MAELWYGHFDSTPEDPRKLLASDWAAYIETFITSGIRSGGSNLRVVQASEPLAVNIEPGAANVRGYIMQIREDLDGANHLLRLPEAHPSFPRIDRIVLRLDRRIAARYVKPMVLMGTAAANPQPPALTRNENEVYELSLAQIRVNAGARFITSVNITDERFSSELCGVINSVLGLDPSSWQSQFDEFFDAFTADSNERDEDFIKDQWDKFTAWMNELQQWTDNQKEYFKQLGDEITNLIKGLETQSFTLINNNFDDWSVKRGCRIRTEFNEDGAGKVKSITSSIRVIALDFVLAVKETEFLEDGSIRETINFNPWEATEGDITTRTTAFAISRRTFFNEDGSIETEVV